MRLGILVAAVAFAIGCSKGEGAGAGGGGGGGTGGGTGGGSGPAAVNSMGAGAATGAAAASGAVTATATGSATATGPAAGTASATATATTGDGGAPCGDKPLAPCPLQGWMKTNTSAAMSPPDYAALAVALDKIVKLAPPGYANWASIAADGADAARAQSLDGVKASCRGCHNQYKARYKKELRTQAIPAI